MDKMSKRKKQEEDTLEDEEDEVEEGVDIPLLPKRTKVQAQRKFAQGSSPLVTPVKDIQPDVDNTPSTTLPTQVFTQAPANQPKTEDFLTFLCFRGTSLVSRRLSDLFSNPSPVIITTPDQRNTTAKKVRKKRLTEEDLKGKIKFTKQKTSAAQLKKLKQQDQTRMRGVQPAPGTPTKVPGQKKQPASPQKQKKLKTKDVAKKSSVATGPARVGTKPGALSLRKAQMTQRERLKSRRAVCKSPSSVSSRSGLRSSGILASGSEEGLPPRKRHRHRQLATLSGKEGQKGTAANRSSHQHKKHSGGDKVVEVMEKKKKHRGNRVEAAASPVVPSVRPSRKSKEAAAVYMEMLGDEVKHPDTTFNEDDNSSVESFPELPKARAMERRERQIKEMVAAEKHRNESKRLTAHVMKPNTLPKTVASKLGSKKVTVQSLLKKRMTRSSIKQPKLRKQPMGKDETLDKRKTRAKLKNKQDTDKTKDKKEEDYNSEEKEETKSTRPCRAVKSVQSKTSERNESPKVRKTRSDLSPVVAIDALSPSKLSKVTMKKEDKEMVLKCNEAKLNKQKENKKNESHESKILESENSDQKQQEIKRNKSITKEEKKTSSQDQEQSRTDDKKVKTRATRSITKANDEEDGRITEVETNKKESKVASKNSNDKIKASSTETKKEDINKIELVSQDPKNLEDQSKNDLEEKVDLSKKSVKKYKPSVKQKINFDEIVRDETFVSKNRAAKSTNEDRKLKPESQGKAKKKKDIEDSNVTVFVTKVDVEKVVDSGSPLKPTVSANKINHTETSEKSPAVKAITFEEKPKTSLNSSSSPEVLKSDLNSPSLSSPSIIPSDNANQTKEVNCSSQVPVVILPKFSSPTSSKSTEEKKSLVVESTKESKETVASEVQNANATSQKTMEKKTDLDKDEDAKSSKIKTIKIVPDLNPSVLPSKTSNTATVPENKVTSVKKTNTDSNTRNSVTSTKVKRVQLTPSKMIVNNLNLPPKKLVSPENKTLNSKDTTFTSSSILNINSNSTLKPRSRATVFVKGSDSSSNLSPMTQMADNFRLNFSKDLDSPKKDSKSSPLNKKETNISESTIAELDKELSNFVKDIVKSDWDGKSFEIPLTAKPVSRDNSGSKSRKQISTIDFINSTPVKCSSSEDATIRSDKVIISPLRKLTENEIRILLAQESPMKTNDKSLVSNSSLENLSRSKVVSESDDTVSKLCIEKITNEIISLIDPKMNIAETQDIIKKYNLNKQLHNRLTEESNKVPLQSSLTPVGQKPETLSSIKVNYTSVTTNSPLPVHRTEAILSQKAIPSVIQPQKRDITSTEKLMETSAKQMTLPSQTLDKIVQPINKQISFSNQAPDKISHPSNKHINLLNITPDKSSRPTNDSFDQSSPNNAKIDKQLLATSQQPSAPKQTLSTDQKPLNKQSTFSPKLDKQTSLLGQRFEPPLPPNQVPKTPDRPLWPQQRSDKHSLLATKKPAALDKQYRLSNQGSMSSSAESSLTTPRSDKPVPLPPQRVDKPSLLPSPRSGTLDKQYRLSKQEADRQALFGIPKEKQPASIKTGNLSSVVSQRPLEKLPDTAAISSQAISSTPEQTSSLNLSQKTTSNLPPSRLNLDVKPQHSSKSSDTKSSSTSTASLASLSTPKSIPNAVNRPSQTFFEVPITLSNTYQTILDSRLDTTRSQVTSIATPKASLSTETPKSDSTCINNVQKADCDKSSLSRTRAKSIEEDNNVIANFIKDKSATLHEKSLDTKESNPVSSSKIPPERQIVKAFEDKYEPKSSPTKNIRKYSNLGKKTPHSKQTAKQDRNFTKSLRTKKDTNYLEDYSSTDSSEDEVTSKTSKSTTRKRKTAPNSKEKTPLSDFSSDSDVNDMIEKIRKDERKKSKANAEYSKKTENADTRKPTASITESNKSTRSAKSDAKKSKTDIPSTDETKDVAKCKKGKEEKAVEENKGNRRLRNKQSVLYNLESLETDSDTPDEEIIPVKRKCEDAGKKRKSKKSSASENEESEDKEAKTKKMKTEPEESVKVNSKRGRKKKQKETVEESEIDKDTTKKNDRVEEETKESSESDLDVKKKKTLKKRSKKQNSKQVTESSDSENDSIEKTSNKKSTKKKNGDAKKDHEDKSLKTEECGSRKNLRRKPCHLYAENLSSNSEDDLELLIQNRSDEIETQNLMNHPRKSKKLLDQILAKSKVETKVKKTRPSRSSNESSSEEDEKSSSKQSKEKENKNEKTKVIKTPRKISLKNTKQSDDSKSESEKSSIKKAKTPKKDAKSTKKSQSPPRDDSPSQSVESSNLKRSRRASRTQSLMIDTSSDDSEDDPLLAIAKTISKNEVRMSRRSIDLLNAKEKEILKKTETSSEEESEEESEDENNKDETRLENMPLEDSSTKNRTKDSENRNEVLKPIPISAKPLISGNTSQCSSLDVSNKISSLIEKDKQKRGLAAFNQDKEAASVSSQLQQEALLRLEKQPMSPATPEKKPISREQLHSSWKSAFQNLKLPKTSPSVSKRPMDRNAWIRKHAMLANSNKPGEKTKSSPFEPFRINYSRSSSPMSLSSQNSDNLAVPVEGKHQHLPVPVEQTLKRMPNISPKINKSFHFEPAKSNSAPPVAEKLTPGKIEDIPKAGNFNEQIMKWLNDSIPNDDSSCDDTNSTGKKLPRYCQDDTDTSAASSVIDKGIVSAPVQLKDIFSSPVSFTSEKISSVKVDDYKKLKQSSADKKDIFTSPSLDRKRYGEETPEKKKHLESETDSLVSDLSSCDETKHEKKAIFQQRRSLAERLKERQTQSTLAKIAFSPQNESSVYAFEPEPTETSPSTPFRRKTATTTSPESPALSKPGSPSNSSIAVQVNFESETVLECSTTQTDLNGSAGVEGEDGHLFYIPLGKPGQSDTSAIQGVAVKLGTEGPDQRVIMSAKLVTKPPEPSDFAKPSSVSCLVPQRRVRPFNTPIIVGTVQPMSRRPTTGTQVSPRSTHTQTPPPIVKAPGTPPPPSSIASSSVSAISSNASTSSQSGKKSKSKSSQSTSTAANKKRPSSPLPSTSSSPSPAAPTAVKNKSFPSKGSRAMMVEAPTYYPSEKEFQDPFEYIEKIRASAEQFGICRIVPPSSFKPECKLNDDMRFTAYNQYVHKMLHRWGPNVKEMVAIRKYLATQSVSMQQLPLIGGIEVDLPRLYSTVQQCGGLGEVLDKKRWHKVADMMRIPRLAQDRAAKLDSIYVSYLLPYDTLSHDERTKLFDAVEAEWGTHFNASLLDDEEEEESDEDDELDECIVKGRNMPLSTFYRVARNTMAMYFKSDNPNDPKSHPTPAEVETEFWNHVNSRMLHICVHSASIDTGSNGCGFPTAKNSTFAKHPWNLKVLTNNSASILRSLNNLVGVTVPTLHVGMLFSACCWYRDPHGLPWIEYLHSGASKIWYGIPDEHSTAFRSTMMSLFPHYCRSEKTIWLSSDVAMVPPTLLTEKGVSLSRLVQEPGQFVVVFPAAFTSSIATGYLVAESVYFARPSWLSTCERVFKDMQDSCEPAEFSLELLLFSIAADSRSNIDVLSRVLPMIESIRDMEVAYRSQLSDLGLRAKERLSSEAGDKKGTPGRKKKAVVTEEEVEHECDVCRVHLPISMVENSEEDVDYCLKHGIEHLSQNPDQMKHCKLLYYYDAAELEELITKLKEKIKTKSLKKLSEKHAA